MQLPFHWFTGHNIITEEYIINSVSKNYLRLNHCGLGTTYGNIDLVQYWLRKWLVAWQHQTITWINVDYLFGRISGILLRNIYSADQATELYNEFKSYFVLNHSCISHRRSMG